MEFLKTILGDDLYKQFETAINAHNGKEENKEKPIKIADLSSGEYTSVNKYNDEVNARTNAENQLTTANELIAQLKRGSKDDPDIQSKISGYESEITKLKAQLATEKLESAINNALRDAKGTDIDYLAFKLKALDGTLELDDNGAIKGIDDKVKTLKTQFPTLFTANDGKNNGTIISQPLPGGNDNGSVTKKDIMKMSYNDRAKLKSESPDVYDAAMKQ